MQAFLAAEEMDLGLNAHLTVTFDGSGTNAVDVKKCIEIQRKLITTITRLFSRNNHDLALVYARETAATGLHVHILFNIKPTRWKEMKDALNFNIGRRLDELGVESRVETINGRPWLPFKITPPQSDKHADVPPNLEDRLRMLGYLMKEIDPVALVETSMGFVPLSDLLAFYLQTKIKTQGTIENAKRNGRSQNLCPTPGVTAIECLMRLNSLRHKADQLPNPEFVAAHLGACSPNPSSKEMKERATKVEDFRQAFVRGKISVLATPVVVEPLPTAGLSEPAAITGVQSGSPEFDKPEDDSAAFGGDLLAVVVEPQTEARLVVPTKDREGPSLGAKNCDAGRRDNPSAEDIARERHLRSIASPTSKSDRVPVTDEEFANIMKYLNAL